MKAPAYRRAAPPDISCRDPRRPNATILAVSGVPLTVSQERLGHADSEASLAFSAHVPPAIGTDAARTLENLLGGRVAEERPRVRIKSPAPLRR